MRFADVIGQEQAHTAALQILKSERFPHALLLHGPEGVGKIAFAIAYIQFILCPNKSEIDSCGECSTCKKVAGLIHPDVHFIFPTISKTVNSIPLGSDEAMPSFRTLLQNSPFPTLQTWVNLSEAENKQLNIGIHEIRKLKKKLSLTSFEGKQKFAIVWHAEKLNTEASNALLKLLEEPPDDTILILTAEDLTLLLPTILSRCQRMRLQRVNTAAISTYLVDQFGCSVTLAQEAASLADGSPAKAIEVINEGNESFLSVFSNWLKICYKSDYGEILKWCEQLNHKGREFQKYFFKYVLEKIRLCVWLQQTPESQSKLLSNEKEMMLWLAQKLSLPALENWADLIEQSAFFISRNANSNLTLMNLSLTTSKFLKAGA